MQGGKIFKAALRVTGATHPARFRGSKDFARLPTENATSKIYSALIAIEKKSQAAAFPRNVVLINGFIST